ncbi:Uncharacterised protein [Staphylococcus gallinarum]|uniref:Uncharacterized protein n=1 Tax=Staphylococcus gallinarum TaxID=1293 RepID=A0A380FH57_STAGA|nr:Uncharacterised protein [Staphylococcus gallinarum]
MSQYKLRSTGLIYYRFLKDLAGLDHTDIKIQVIPEVLNRLEDDAAQITDEAHHLMNNHAILLYPLDILEFAPLAVWIEAYVNYFKSMLGLEEIDESNEVTKFTCIHRYTGII